MRLSPGMGVKLILSGNSVGNSFLASSYSFGIVNGGIDTLLQLYGCIAKIYLFLGPSPN